DVRFPYLTKADQRFSSVWGVGGIETITETRIGADNLAWERAIKSNLGIEGKLFNNKIDFVIDFFQDQRNGIFQQRDRKSTRLNSSHVKISYAVFCLKKKKIKHIHTTS